MVLGARVGSHQAEMTRKVMTNISLKVGCADDVMGLNNNIEYPSYIIITREGKHLARSIGLLRATPCKENEGS